MGCWGPGPFDNDLAGDFQLFLSEMEPTEREVRLRLMLSRPADHIIQDWEESVAAAAVIAEQCPGGERFTPSWQPPQYRPTPPLPLDLRPRAAAALVLVYNSEALARGWFNPRDRDRWRTNLAQLHETLTEQSDAPQQRPGTHLGISPRPTSPATSVTNPRRR
ncbi:DUF4259 domain-containing protein [Streptomyces cyaneofuscatus]|uniref:DUF4259 domain-containing protein n=1 Tax=Streptomyces cyaneofuscatus TaxID=66883 RepID=UPI00380A7CA9